MKRENSPKVVKQYLSSNENNVEKIQARTGIEPMTFAILVQYSATCANEPNGSWSLYRLVINSVLKWWIDENHTCELRIKNYCEARFHIHFLIRSLHIWFSYIYCQRSTYLHNQSSVMSWGSDESFCFTYIVVIWRMRKNHLCKESISILEPSRCCGSTMEGSEYRNW